MSYTGELQDLATDTIALVFGTQPDLAAHAAKGMDIVRTVCPWATDAQVADILHFASLTLEAVKLDVAGIGAEKSLSLVADTFVAGEAFARARVAGKI